MAKKDPYKSYDTIGLVFSVLGLVFCLTGIFGILFGALGLFFAKHKKDTPTAQTARVLGILAIVISSILLGVFILMVIISSIY